MVAILLLGFSSKAAFGLYGQVDSCRELSFVVVAEFTVAILEGAQHVHIASAPKADALVAAQENHMFKKDSDTYDIYLLPPGEDVETCTSWLRMRNRDGRYNLMFEEWVTDGPFIISPRITFEVGLPTACHAFRHNVALQSCEFYKKPSGQAQRRKCHPALACMLAAED